MIVSFGAPTTSCRVCGAGIVTLTALAAFAGVIGAATDAVALAPCFGTTGPEPPAFVSGSVPDPWAVIGAPGASG